MTNSKINSLLLPLLFAILLTVTSSLKVGKAISSFFYTLLTPIHVPIGGLHMLVEKNIGNLKNLPQLSSEQIQLKLNNAYLVSENQRLRDAIKDQETADSLKNIYQKSVPIRLITTAGKIIASTNTISQDIKPGQPVVSGSLLLGLVSEVNGKIVNIAPLTKEGNTPLLVRTVSGQNGNFIYAARTPQITDIPSQNPLNLGDIVLTQPTAQIPDTLIIGKIVKVLSSPQEPLVRAELKLEMSFSDNPPNLSIITLP